MTDSKIIPFLKDWMIRYMKNKDLITKKILSIKEKESSFVVVKSDKEQELFIVPFITDIEASLKDAKSHQGSRSVVCFHTKGNFDILMKNWKVFVSLGRTFTVYFVNPFSKTDRVLVLSPHTHDLISDDESLEQGLKTMAETVEFTTEEEIKKIVNS